MDSLEEILLANSNTNVLDNVISQELAPLIILLSKGFAQFENKSRLYIRFKESYHGEFLNSVTYSRLISYTVKHLYKKSKCDTVKEYFQRISDYPSKDVFDCKLATQLFNMRSHLNFSQEEQFLYNVQTLQCSHTSLLLFLYKYIRNGFLLAIAIILISCHNFARYCQTILRSLSHYRDKARLHVTCTAALLFVLLLLLIPFTYYKIFESDIVLIIEVTVKLFCYLYNDIVTSIIFFFSLVLL